jgi:Transposase DDE domain
MWLKQYWTEVKEDRSSQLHLRTDDNPPPGAQRLHSPYDEDARFSAKREMEWVGYKTHLTEVRFSPAVCWACPSQTQCPRAKNGASRITTSATRASYSGVPSEVCTTGWDRRNDLRDFELRVARYLGLAQTHLQMLATATAINLHRLFDGWEEKPRAKTRVSSFAKLAPAPVMAVPSWGAA